MVKGQYVMKKRKLVIINDNERFCMELESRFVKYGYIVMAKLKTADEALSFFEKGNKPDVAIVDMLMPKYDGSQLLHRIKTMGKGKGTVFIGIFQRIVDGCSACCRTRCIEYPQCHDIDVCRGTIGDNSCDMCSMSVGVRIICSRSFLGRKEIVACDLPSGKDTVIFVNMFSYGKT